MSGAKTVEVKVEHLVGPMLDWVVAMAVGESVVVQTADDRARVVSENSGLPYEPSVDWGICGPLIAKFGVSLIPPERPGPGGVSDCPAWVGSIDALDGAEPEGFGLTPSEAICLTIAAYFAFAQDRSRVTLPVELLTGYVWRPGFSAFLGPLPWDGVFYETYEDALAASEEAREWLPEEKLDDAYECALLVRREAAIAVTALPGVPCEAQEKGWS